MDKENLIRILKSNINLINSKINEVKGEYDYSESIDEHIKYHTELKMLESRRNTYSDILKLVDI